MNAKNVAEKSLIYLFLGCISIAVIFPIFYSVMGSLKPTMEILTGTNIIPKTFVWDNYVRAFKEANFSQYTFNSVFISSIVTLFSLFNVCVVGFCLARVNFVGRKLLKALILATMFISLGPMTLAPMIQVVTDLGISRSIWSIILGTVVGVGAPVFIFEAYFKGQGDEIDEAARIDGCGFFGRFFYIGLPLSKPLMATFAVMFFNHSWNDFFWPYVLTFNNPDIQPLVVAVISLRSVMGEAATEWGLLMAGTSIAIIPVILVYLFTSRWMIQGITEGAVKM